MMCKVRKSLTLLEKTDPDREHNSLLGLTLLELIIVVVTIGIIAALAIPGYLGVKRRANQRGASTLLTLIHAAEKVYQLEVGGYVICTGFNNCNNMLNLDLPDDGWTYAVTLVSDFTATAAKDGCTYTMDRDDSEPSGSGCIYTP